MDCRIASSKTVLLFLSLLFWAVGAALAYTGAHLIEIYSNLGINPHDKVILSPAIIIIAFSVVMFLFGLLGCCATIWESRFCLSIFFWILFVIFTAEVVVLVLSFLCQNKINSEMGKTLNATFSKYDGNDKEIVDNLQSELKCCGVFNYTSWLNTNWSASHPNSVPKSCCKNMNGTCNGTLTDLKLLHLNGCETKLQGIMHHVFYYAMGVILGFAILKFLGMLSVCVIACSNGSRRSGYEPLYA
ncbi:tetraspanin-36-like [Anabas testudineus]|uniref:tetraspanin-36-like n=1 Tax=Anabas testudineus TaxID=64144 RepID=UPI000E45D174|nr:tetraspanin-36-like [Anabas testudineus]